MCLFLDKCTIISMKPRSVVVLSAHRALHISLRLTLSCLASVPVMMTFSLLPNTLQLFVFGGGHFGLTIVMYISLL
jgi:hypothetical protein